MNKELFLTLASEQYSKLEKIQKETDNMYDYEKAFEELWLEYGRKVIEQTLSAGKQTKDRRKKKL